MSMSVGFGKDVIGAHSQDSVDAVVTLVPPANARRLIVQAVGQNVRFTLDGTNPTAALGFRLYPNQEPTHVAVLPDMTLKFIEEMVGGSIEYQWGD